MLKPYLLPNIILPLKVRLDLFTFSAIDTDIDAGHSVKIADHGNHYRTTKFRLCRMLHRLSEFNVTFIWGPYGFHTNK